MHRRDWTRRQDFAERDEAGLISAPPFPKYHAKRTPAPLEAKLEEWQRFYNFHRAHGMHNGKTPYEAPREKL
jgi:hypothetical protein